MRTVTSSLGASTRNRLRTLQKVLAICTAGLFIVGAGRASAQGEALPAETTASDSQLAGRVDQLMAHAVSSGFGGAIILERDGRQVLARGYGLANRRLNTRFTTDTIAPINSITKSFTALAMMQLSARGQVDLQAPLKAYLKRVDAIQKAVGAGQ